MIVTYYYLDNQSFSGSKWATWVGVRSAGVPIKSLNKMTIPRLVGFGDSHVESMF